jgi:DNA-binding NtrC family response regulator
MEQMPVLVVDDDAIVRKVVQKRLARIGLGTEEAASAAEALAKMEKCLYPIVIADIHMPGMSGVELVAALKQRSPLVQVIMLTSDACLERVIECMDRGAIDFFGKDEDGDTILQSVRGAVARAQRWRSRLGTIAEPLLPPLK